MNRMRMAASTLVATSLLAASAFGHVDGARPHLHTEQGVVSLPLQWIGVALILLASALLRRRSRRTLPGS